MSGHVRGEVLRRIDLVYRMQLLGLRRAQVIETIAQKYPTWRVSERTIDFYIHEAKEIMRVAGAYEHQLEKGRAMGRMHEVVSKALAEKRYGEAIKAQDQINRLCGLYEPLEVNVNEARRELVDQLLEEVLREANDATAGAARED